MKMNVTKRLLLPLALAGILFVAGWRSGEAETPAPAGAAGALATVRLQAPAGSARTILFLEWTNVEKGKIESVYDPSRLTDEARKVFEINKKDFGIDPRIGKHGMAAYHVPEGIRIAVEKARKTDRWLKADRPWETSISGGNVLFDEGRFRCWYSASLAKEKQQVVFAEGRAMEVSGTATCYAESNDGIHWAKPSLGLFAFDGSKENNIVSPLWVDSPFRDDHGTPEERYKAFTFAELPAEDVPKGAGAFYKYGLYGLVSPDGYHWTQLPKPLVRHFCDTWNIAGWDPLLKKYVGYFRGHTGGRSITRAETDDFHNWPMPQTLMYAGAEEGPSEDYYTSAYTTYPGIPRIRLMFPAIYHQNTDYVDVRLATSSDGQGWNWVSRVPIIDHGAPGEWDRGSLYGQPNLLRLPDGRLALPYNGYDQTHNEGFSNSYKDWPKSETGMAWAVWDEGRLAGIQADGIGRFYAVSEDFKGGQILINARTAPGGRVEVELVQKDKVLPGFAFADCVPFRGDGRWVPLRWKGKADLSELKGKRFQLHFRLTKAKVFGYRIVDPEGKADESVQK
jgi:hypothetical protein